MLFQGEFFTEIGEIGNQGGLRTLLLRGAQGGIVVYKEIGRESVEIFQKLKAAPHPNIAAVYGIKAVDEETCGVFMEYVPADTLDDRILERGSLPLDETRKIMLQVCAAVRHFHGLGIIHRDLKPLNILVMENGWVKVTDFGIARLYSRGKMADTQVLGTAGYAAPEQFGFSQTDEKADIYALGVILNRMLTGKMPGEKLYEGDARIGALIRQCLCMSPGDRCSIDDVEEALGGQKSGGSFFKRLVRKIPGFRTGNKVHMALASVEYAYMSLIFLLSVLFQEGIFAILVSIAGLLISTLGIGWFIGSFRPTAYRLHMDKGAGRVILTIFYVILGFVILSVGMTMVL